MSQTHSSQHPPDQRSTAAGLVVPRNRAAVDAVPEDVGDEQHQFLFFNVLPSWMVSFLAHVVIIIVLAFYMLPRPIERTVALEAGEPSAALEESIDLSVDLDFSETDPLQTEEFVEPMAIVSESFDEAVILENSDFGEILGAEFAVESEMSELSSMDAASETSSRSEASRTDMLKKYGGTAASEEAVALALKWIIAHQLPDGGWSFDHQQGPGNHRNSPHPGEFADARCGATAMALLPLLGAGQTHRTGQYREQIERGMQFLVKNAERKGRGISFWDPQGTMYSHGLVAIVFNEAYAMTKDPELAPFAQGTIYYIEDAQDPVGGGWRYKPREPGDTSVVGWQMMAMKSGYATGMKIAPKTLKLTEKFLDSVSTSGGAFYGYMDPPRGRPADGRTAIGLLCRMYMGWAKDAPGLVDGVQAITDRGPRVRDDLDMYYNYYATQVIKQYGGQIWTDWNNVMRDFLVKSQIKDGPGAGSWNPGNTFGDSKGGRLFATSLACMTLEVYYRYLPIYGDDATRGEFKLD
jgi:hypothetical protein